MTNDTTPDRDDPTRRRSRELDDGELLTIDAGGWVLLRLPAWRAADLARVLDAYTRMVALVDEASQVSGTEAGLSRALRDASSAAALPSKAT